MNWWIYKCNSNKGAQNRHGGDWGNCIHFQKNKPFTWEDRGEFPKGVDQLGKDDIIIAQQKDKNIKLVGIAKVHRCDGDLDLKWRYKFGNEVRLQKVKENPQVAKIKAFKPGEIKTVYPIDEKEIRILLREIAKAWSKKNTAYLLKAAEL